MNAHKDLGFFAAVLINSFIDNTDLPNLRWHTRTLNLLREL
jgi:hypothetical protein